MCAAWRLVQAESEIHTMKTKVTKIHFSQYPSGDHAANVLRDNDTQRCYFNPTPSSLERLSTLFFCYARTTWAHCAPYLDVWVIF